MSPQFLTTVVDHLRNAEYKGDLEMARYTGPKAKIARKFGENIFGNEKISKILERKNYPPGQHGQSRRRRPSNYAMQLREKQKNEVCLWTVRASVQEFFRESRENEGRNRC